MFACLPLGARIGNRLLQRGKAARVLSILFFAALLVLCIASLMNDTYSSFLYFKF